MESNLIPITQLDSTMNLERSYEISDAALDRGAVIKYETISYRGQEVNFLADVTGTHCYAQWGERIIDLGTHNLHYKDDMCRFIDRHLDLISDFRNSPDFAGAKLEYFHNGDYRDIRLTYRGRILKVFLVVDKVNETFLISESERILRNSGLLEIN